MPRSTHEGFVDAVTGQLGRRQFLKAASAARLGVAGVSACSARITGTPVPAGVTPRYSGRLYTGHIGGGLVETLELQRSLALTEEARDRQLYGTPTFFRPDWAMNCRLAEGLEPSANATSFQLKLRRGGTFHNGKPLIADDVLYTWRRIPDPKTVSGGAAASAP